MIHNSWAPPTSSDLAISGRAKVKAVLSTATSSTANISRARASQSRQGAAVLLLGYWRAYELAGELNMPITVPSGRYSFNVDSKFQGRLRIRGRWKLCL